MKNNYLLARSWGNRANEYETFNKQHLIDLLVERDVEINRLSAELDTHKDLKKDFGDMCGDAVVKLVQSGEYSPKVLVIDSNRSYEA